jgi:hypothetical protein
MKKLLEATTTGGVTPGGYNKPMSTIIKRTITTNPDAKSQASPSSGCPCKNLPGKVTCGICNPRKH